MSKYKASNVISRTFPMVLLITATLLFTYCKRTSKDEQILGPELKPASSSFYVKGTNQNLLFRAYSVSLNDTVNTINFATDAIYFKSGFSETVTWTISIVGMSSGATKTISGTSDSITSSNSLWSGEAEGTRFFRKGENAVATLSFLGSSIMLKDTILIFNTKSYNGTVINGVTYHLIDDFDGTAKLSLSSVTPDLKDLDVSFANDSLKVVNGKYSFRFRGNDANWNSYLGAIASKNLSDYIGIIKTTDPNNLYFNLYIYGTGTPQTSVAVELAEDEHAPAAYDFSKNDAYISHIPVNWVGWKLVSVPYSLFKRAPNPKSGGNGNGVMEPNLVSGVVVTLESYPTGGKTVDAYIDMVTLTEGGPFVP